MNKIQVLEAGLGTEHKVTKGERADNCAIWVLLLEKNLLQELNFI